MLFGVYIYIYFSHVILPFSQAHTHTYSDEECRRRNILTLKKRSLANAVLIRSVS